MKAATKYFFAFTLGAAVLVVLFVLPIAAINGWVTDSTTRTILLVMSFILSFTLWGVVSQTLLLAAAGIYGFKKLQIGKLLVRIRRSGAARSRIKSNTVVFLFLSALTLVYWFAILYGCISVLDSSAFKSGPLSYASAFYFSFLAMTNSLNDDILPVSDFARMATVVQMVAGMLYALFFFSFLAAFIRDQRR